MFTNKYVNGHTLYVFHPSFGSRPNAAFARGSCDAAWKEMGLEAYQRHLTWAMFVRLKSQNQKNQLV